MVDAGRGVLRGIVEQVEQRLLEQHGIDHHHRQVGGQVHLHAVIGQDPARPRQRGCHDLPHVVRADVGNDGAGLELGHVEQVGDEAIEALGLVDDGGDQVGLGVVVERGAEVAQRPGRAQHGRERRLQVVRDRGEQGRAQAVRLGDALDPVDVLDEVHPLDGQRALVDQRVQQPPLLDAQKRPRLVAADADDADRAPARAHRLEQPFRAGQRIRVAPRRPVLLPGPFGGGQVRLVERVLGRIAGLDGDRAVARAAAAPRAP